MHVLLEHTEKVWIFLKVAECGSVSRSAEVLHLSQPTITYAIKTLEQHLGFKLFIRSSKGMTLNAAGKSLLEDARSAQSILMDIEQRLLRKDVLIAPKKIILGTYESIAVYLWPKLTRRLDVMYPTMEMSLVTRRSHEVVGDILSGKVDAGLIVGKFDTPELVKIPLYQDHYSFYSAIRTPFNGNLSYPIITVPDSLDSNGVSLASWVSRSIFSQHPQLSLSSFEVCSEFAAQGLGVTILPNRVYEHQKKTGRKLNKVLNCGLDDATFGKHDFYFCYRPGSPQSDRFKEHLAKQIKKL